MSSLAQLTARALLALALSVLAWPAAAATLVRFVSDPGSAFPGALTRVFTAPDATFQVASGPLRAAPTGIRVTVTGTPPGGTEETWNFDFEAPVSQPLAPGNYERARRAPFASATLPGMQVTGSGECNELTGQFTVREIQFDLGGNVQKLAIDFVQHCDRLPPALRGELRIDSDVPIDSGIVAVAGWQQIVPPGKTVVLDGAGSYGLGTSSINAFAWRQLSGPVVVLAKANEAVATFTAPVVATGGADVVLELEVSDGQGGTSTDTTTVHIWGAQEARDLVFLDTQPGVLIPTGQTLFTDVDGVFVPTSAPGEVIIDAKGEDAWRVDMNSGTGAGRIPPGTYDEAGGGPGKPRIDLIGRLGVCQNTGRSSFQVLEAEYGASDEVLKFAVDFTLFCGPTLPPQPHPEYAVVGSVRFNSAVPLPTRAPVANASAVKRIGPGLVVDLDASASFDPSHGSLQFAWTQTAGPAVSLVNANTSNARFTAPAVPAQGADLSFQVAVTNAGGTDTHTLTVHVVGDGEPKSLLHVRSVGADPIGGGATATLYDWTSTILALNPAGGVSVVVSTPPSGSWNVLLQAALAGEVQPGTYVDVIPGSAPSDAPKIDVARGANCATATGRFVVREATYSAGSIDTFAADFVQRCSDGALFGAVRVNSALPVSAEGPTAVASGPESVDPESTFVLDASPSSDPLDSPLAFQWTQLSGPPAVIGDARSMRPVVRIRNGVPAGDMVFRVVVSSEFGLSDSKTMVVHLRSNSEARTIARFERLDRASIAADRAQTLTGAAVTFEDVAGAGSPTVRVTAGSGSDGWIATFAAPTGHALGPGLYLGAIAQATPAVGAVRAQSQGTNPVCATPEGWFRIFEIDLSQGASRRLAVDFKVDCGPGTAPVFGSIRINSARPLASAPTTTVFMAPATGVGQLQLDLTGGGTSCGLSYARALPAPPGSGEVPPTLPGPGVQFPYGMVVFATANCDRGSAVSFVVTYPVAVAPDTVYWKYGPTPTDATNHWYQIPATINGNTIGFTIVDGGLGDDDLVANGVVIDAGGAGVVASAVQGPPPVQPIPSPPAAIAVAPTSVPTLQPAMLAVLALTVIGAAGLVARKRM